MATLHRFYFNINLLTVLRTIDFSIKFDTVKSECFIEYIEGLQVLHPPPKKKKTQYISFLRSYFVSTNSADPDEMSPYTAFHLGIHCLL